MKKLKHINKNTITLDEIEKMFNIKEYIELYKTVKELLENGELEIMKNSSGNGRNPGLYKKYRILKSQEDYSEYLNEMNFSLSTKFDISYYKNHLHKYKEHRNYIIMLNDFVINNEDKLKVPISMNERSFEIWGREKFLQKEIGKTILKNLNIDAQYINYYETSEPLAYYSRSRVAPQNILIIENKDTYYTMRKYLINCSGKILGLDIDTIIYGGGKGIVKAFKDFDISVEDYISDKRNVIYYFGDLDYEGIVIYESFYERACLQYNIRLFLEGYQKMIDKYIEEDICLPDTKEGQNKNIKDYFLDSFNEYYKNKINYILQRGVYIPQEILNIKDL